MKTIALASIFIAIATTSLSASAAPRASCETIALKIVRATNDFNRIRDTATGSLSVTRMSPAELYRDRNGRDAALQETANKLWDLRTEMINRQCGQASSFAF